MVQFPLHLVVGPVRVQHSDTDPLEFPGREPKLTGHFKSTFGSHGPENRELLFSGLFVGQQVYSSSEK